MQLKRHHNDTLGKALEAQMVAQVPPLRILAAVARILGCPNFRDLITIKFGDGTFPASQKAVGTETSPFSPSRARTLLRKEGWHVQSFWEFRTSAINLEKGLMMAKSSNKINRVFL